MTEPYKDDDSTEELKAIDRLIRNRLWQQCGMGNAEVEAEIERLDREEDQRNWPEPRDN